MGRDSGSNVWSSYLLFPRSAGLVTLCEYNPVEFTIIKSNAMTLSRSPQCRAFGKVTVPTIPVGAVAGQCLQMTGA